MRRAGLRGLAALPRRTRTTDSRHAYPIAPNRLGRDFTTVAPNQVWLADLTYVPTGEGWLYLAAVLDLHTRKIVGWSMRETLRTEIAIEALDMAIERQRPSPGLIHHSDRGIQYAAEAYRQRLARSGITPSMSRRGDCLDNGPNGELLPHSQNRACPPPDLSDASRSPPRSVRLHRGLL
jgi:putative transposase